MRMRGIPPAAAALAALVLVACGDTASLPVEAGMGPNPTLPPPKTSLIPTIKPFAGGRPSGPAVDGLTGFLTDAGEGRGRPVGVTTDRRGALLVADDVGDVIRRVTKR